MFPMVGLKDVSTISLIFPSPMGDMEETISSSNEYESGRFPIVGVTYWDDAVIFGVDNALAGSGSLILGEILVTEETRSLLRISSYATRRYRIPKMGFVYTKRNTVMAKIEMSPKGDSTMVDINLGEPMGDMI